MKKICILGSTGSIGTQTLDVINFCNDIQVISLSTNKNINLLYKQILHYKPKVVSVVCEDSALKLKNKLKLENIKTEVLAGTKSLIDICTLNEINLVVNSLVGNVGLTPTIESIKHKKNIALANKETLVTAGEIIINLAKKHNINIYPIDSEHSAIFQCLNNNKKNEVEKIILTASGGPFVDKTLDELKNVTLEDALKHPNWSMGKKITIDSSTLMNKGLEVIEAKWLFNISHKQIDVVIHRQSIIHSMVEYVDGSIIAQLSSPDMRLPIQYAINYPKRIKNNFNKLNFYENNKLTFEKVDYEKFPCLKYAFDCLEHGGIMPIIYNGANEIANSLFLNKKIPFNDISKIIFKSLNYFIQKNTFDLTIEKVLDYDEQVKKYVYSNYKKI